MSGKRPRVDVVPATLTAADQRIVWPPTVVLRDLDQMMPALDVEDYAVVNGQISDFAQYNGVKGQILTTENDFTRFELRMPDGKNLWTTTDCLQPVAKLVFR